MNTTKGIFSSKSDEWRTPEKVFERLNSEFQFDDDPCPVGARDGLTRNWKKNVFINPPYSMITEFLEKCQQELITGITELAVFLIPSRTDTKYWHKYVMRSSEIRFIKGRLKFGGGQTKQRSISKLNHCFQKTPFIRTQSHRYMFQIN